MNNLDLYAVGTKRADSFEALSITNGELVKANDLKEFISRLLEKNISYVYILKGTYFATLCDDYALKNNFVFYDDLNDHTNQRKRINVEAWARRDGDGICYNRKFWIYSTRKGKNADRHKRLRSITFLNFEPLVGTTDLEELRDTFSIEGGRRDLDEFKDIVISFNEYFEKISGEPLLGKRPKVLTIGSAAKNFYLKLKYPESKNPFKEYQKQHPQTEVSELHYRNGNLLLGGTLYLKKNIQGKLLKGHYRKYDKNSLYPYIAQRVGEISAPVLSSVEEFETSEVHNEIFILKFNRLVLEVKDGMPPIFSNPFDDTAVGESYIEITREWYVFAPLFLSLTKYYKVIEMELVGVFKCVTEHDSAMNEFVNRLNRLKSAARAKNNPGLSKVAKLFSNNLCGKFLQTSYYPERELKMNSDGVVELKETGNTISKWKQNHFDFLRGAFIYVMARVLMYEDIFALCQLYPDFNEHLLYCDTDCIITDYDLPAEWIDSLELGKYKIENEYEALCIYGAKTYFGTNSKEVDFKCTGINRKSLRIQVAKLCKADDINDLTPEQIYEATKGHEPIFYTNQLKRLPGGGAFVKMFRAITQDIFEGIPCEDGVVDI